MKSAIQFALLGLVLVIVLALFFYAARTVRVRGKQENVV